MRYVAALLGAFALNLAFAPAAEAEKRVALVIGNGAYLHTSALSNPSNDAVDMATALKGLGFQVIEGRDLDKRSMERVIRQFALELVGVDVALFYFAGHGLQVDGQNYLMPTDARLSSEGDVDFESVPLNLVLKQMERETRASLILLDACRDNPLARNLARAMSARSAQIGQGLAEVRTGVGTLIGFSTQPGSFALDGAGRNSPYAAALLKHMEMPGKDISAILIAVRADVLQATAGRQVPWEHTSLTGQVFLRANAKPLTAGGKLGGSETSNSSVGAASPAKSYDTELEIAYWDSVKKTKSSAALQAYLDRYPNGAFAGVARLRLADLAQNRDPGVGGAAKPSGNDPTPTKKPVLLGEDVRTLSRALRGELDRVGCDPGDSSSAWDAQAKKALADFSRYAKVTLPNDAPTATALDAVRAREERVCPLKCGKGETENDGRCVAKVREERERPTARNAERKGQSGGKLCWTATGPGGYAGAPKPCP